MEADVRLSRKELCAMFNVTLRTVKYYEYLELLRPEVVNGVKVYGRREVARMKLIRRGQRFGMTLEEIRQWLEIYHTKGERAQLEAWVQIAERQLDVLQRDRARLDSSISELIRLRDESQSMLAGAH